MEELKKILDEQNEKENDNMWILMLLLLILWQPEKKESTINIYIGG